MALTNEKIKKKRKEKKKQKVDINQHLRTYSTPWAECNVTSSYGKVRLQPGSRRCQSFCPANTIVRLSEWCQLTLNHTNIAATTVLLAPTEQRIEESGENALLYTQFGCPLNTFIIFPSSFRSHTRNVLSLEADTSMRLPSGAKVKCLTTSVWSIKLRRSFPV